MPAQNQKKFSALILISILFFVALIGNFYLFYQAKKLYFQVNTLRMDPLEIRKFNPVSLKPLDSRKKLKFIFFGDSRAKHWTAPNEYKDIEFINRGIAGQTSAQVLGRYDYHIKPYRPDYLLIQVGINDIKTIGMVSSARSVITQYKNNIDSLIEKASKDGIHIILTTIFPTAKPTIVRNIFWSKSANEAIKELNDHIRSIKKSNIKIFDTAKILRSKHKFMEKDYASDFLHLSEAGHQILNNYLVIPKID